MKKIKTSSKKYPLKIVLSNGIKITVPKQSEFSSDWLRHHGCSLMAEFVALQFLGIYKKWPINLLSWHRKHTPGDIKSKVTVKGVAKGIKAIGKNKGTATYYRTPTANLIRTALKKGYLVILEQKDPIHSIALVYDKATYKISYGNVTKTTVAAIAKTATTNSTYKGMVVVRRGKK